MAKTIANCAIWLDDQAIASSVNQVTVQATAAELDVTTMLDTSIRRLGGLSDAVISAAGFWDSAEPDNTLFGDIGTNVPVTVGTAQGAVGSTAYILNALLGEYSPNGNIGKALAFKMKAAGIAGLAQGVLAFNGAQTTTVSSAVYQLAAPILGQSVAAALHVLAVSGTTPSMIVTVKSSAVIGMTSPTTRMTFNSFNAIGSQLIQVAGPITDTYWQITATIAGTTPSFTFASALGIAF